MFYIIFLSLVCLAAASPMLWLDPLADLVALYVPLAYQNAALAIGFLTVCCLLIFAIYFTMNLLLFCNIKNRFRSEQNRHSKRLARVSSFRPVKL